MFIRSNSAVKYYKQIDTTISGKTKPDNYNSALQCIPPEQSGPLNLLN